ncbi:DUF917 domain-containing protein [Glaciecola sp. 2405UD65-10]|uniref:DUF917 domain-containing protein n=1 Tax=Glaciecola sp. 2405UD65-10 TaxID=3397244 RepID=UPI003B5A9E1B
MMLIKYTDLDDLSLGAVFLATGGGGDPYIPQLLCTQILKQYGPVTLLNVNELADDAHVISLGGVGAPTVGLELLPSIDESILALEAYEAYTGRTVDALIAFEIGGANSLVPIMAAAMKGIPLIDGDGMGRALPEAQMMTYAINGASPTPAVSLDYAGNVTCFSSKDTPTYERHIRALTQASGGMLISAEHPMRGDFLKQSVINGTVSFSMRLGKVLRENKGNAESLLEPLQAILDGSVYGACRLLYTGKVTDYASSIVNGFDVGKVVIESFSKDKPAMTVNIKNEYLSAHIGSELIISVPDLIVIVEYETSVPINAERLKYGQRVAVFGITCPEFFQSEKALKAVSPRCFGFDFDYSPLK